MSNPTSGSNTRSEASIAATSPTRTALFLDLGDTLVRTKDKEIDRSQKGRVSFLPNVIDIFRSRTDEFDAVFVITNQSGIHKGLLTVDDSNAIIKQVDQALDGKLTDAWASPLTQSDYRKPHTGMLLGLAGKHYVDLSMSTMVGDAGIGTFIWAHEFFGWDPDPEAIEILSPKSVLHHGEVFRRGDVVVRDPGPWTPAVHGLLHHLEGEDFPSSRLADPPLDEVRRERLTFVEGDTGWNGALEPEATFALGEMIRRLHEATATFSAPTDARWYEWCGRSLGDSERIVGHCDLAPWNIVCRDGMPVALIDFDFAGPTAPVSTSLKPAGPAPSFTMRSSRGPRVSRPYTNGRKPSGPSSSAGASRGYLGRPPGSTGTATCFSARSNERSHARLCVIVLPLSWSFDRPGRSTVEIRPPNRVC